MLRTARCCARTTIEGSRENDHGRRWCGGCRRGRGRHGRRGLLNRGWCGGCAGFWNENGRRGRWRWADRGFRVVGLSRTRGFREAEVAVRIGSFLRAEYRQGRCWSGCRFWTGLQCGCGGNRDGFRRPFAAEREQRQCRDEWCDKCQPGHAGFLPTVHGTAPDAWSLGSCRRANARREEMRIRGGPSFGPTVR